MPGRGEAGHDRGAPGTPSLSGWRGVQALPVRAMCFVAWVKREGRSQECKGRVRGPLRRPPPSPALRAAAPPVGAGAGRGGAAEAGLPSPDVTSRPPRANQELPRPQPNSASLCSFPSFTLRTCSLRAATTQSWSGHFPTHLHPPQQLLPPHALSSRSCAAPVLV